jgi:hypothetical protein
MLSDDAEWRGVDLKRDFNNVTIIFASVFLALEAPE